MKIDNWLTLSSQQKMQLLERPAFDYQCNQIAIVKEIIAEVQEKKDAALFSYTQSFDHIKLNALSVTAAEFDQAKNQVSAETLEALEFAAVRIKKYHATQNIVDSLQNSDADADIICERIVRPIEKIGLYIPGGTAPLISTVLMLAIPAQLAGCRERVLCTPPNKKGLIDANLLVAAALCDITQIYKVGGAQAIAAMAYGTESISAVHKIFGPGNSWVTLAKQLVAMDPYAAVTIDMPAGPSELLIIADQQAMPDLVAADLLSQAEHGADSQVILISDSEGLLEAVLKELAIQTDLALRKEIIEQSLAHARFILVPTIEIALEISNHYAPEHLILNIAEAEHYKNQVCNAGAVFLGPFTAETLGDYVNGSNHVLPTSGYAKSISGLSLADFTKYISFQTVTKRGLDKAGKHAAHLAGLEGLAAHKNAIDLRLQKLMREE